MQLVNDDSATLVKPRIVNSKKTATIDAKSVCWFLLGLQLLMANITKHSIYYQISALLFITVCFLYLFVRKAIKINKYYLISAAFIFYNLVLILAGAATDTAHSTRMLMTISINFVLLVLIYCFLVYVKDTDRLVRLYINIIALCDIVILFIFRGSLLTGRLAFSWGDDVSSYRLFGIEVITDGSNGIAYFSAIAILFTTYLLIKKQNKVKYIIYDFLFLFSILASGSRKGIIILVIGLLFLLNLLGKKSQKIIYILLAIGCIGLLFYLIQNVPAFYKIMGSRLEGLYNFLLHRHVRDSSINTRQHLIQQAITYIKKRPMVGHGLDAFRIMGPWGIVSDNNYLDILVSSGLLGFLIYYSYIPLVLYDYLRLKKKSDFCKIFFFIFLLNAVMELGQVTYFERNFGFFYAMLFYILHKETYEVEKIKCESAT